MDFFAVLYAIVGIAFLGAGVPQLRKLGRDQSGASSTLTSWALFTACSAITVGYAFTHTHDRLFIISAAVCTVASLLMLSIACVQRLQFVHQRNATRPNLYY